MAEGRGVVRDDLAFALDAYVIASCARLRFLLLRMSSQPGGASCHFELRQRTCNPNNANVGSGSDRLRESGFPPLPKVTKNLLLFRIKFGVKTHRDRLDLKSVVRFFS